MKHRFLSKPWFDAYEALASGVEMPEPLRPVVANLKVATRLGEVVDARIDGGFLRQGLGADAIATISAPEDVIYQGIVLGNAGAATRAIFNGSLKIDGNKAALVRLAMTPPSDSQKRLTLSLQEITET